MRLEELREDIPEVPEKIHAMITEEVDNRLANTNIVPIRKKHSDRKNRKIFVAAMAGTLILFAVGCATTQFLLWSKQPQVSKYVNHEIYRDKDKHIAVSVEELVSDGACTRAIVKLRARDKEGEEWLRNDKPDNNKIAPYIKFYSDSDIQGYGNRWVRFLDEVSNEKEEYYYMECSDPMGMTDGVVFTYSLPNEGLIRKKINIKNKIPVKEYRMVSKDGEKLSEYYEPQMLRISPLSFNIFGMGNGLWFCGIRENHYVIELLISVEELWEERVDKAYLVKENGEESCIRVSSDPGVIHEPVKSVGEYNCAVASGNFDDAAFFTGWDEEKLQTWNLDDVVAIRLENKKKSVVYTLEEL